MTRLGSWLVNAAIPRSIADQLIAPIRRAHAGVRRLGGAARSSADVAGQPTPGKSRQPHSMSTTAEAPRSEITLKTTVVENPPYVGLVTRAISWCVDFLIINLVAIITGLGIQLVASIFPITKDLKPLFVAIAGGVYVLWTAAYFVAFWSITGQTIGSRLLQVRLVTASGGKVKPVRGAGALDRDEPRAGAVAVGLRADPAQAPGLPGLACPYACDRGRTALDRRGATGKEAPSARRLPTAASASEHRDNRWPAKLTCLRTSPRPSAAAIASRSSRAG